MKGVGEGVEEYVFGINCVEKWIKLKEFGWLGWGEGRGMDADAPCVVYY